MDGLVRAVGDGIGSIWTTAMNGIAAGIEGVVNALNSVVPGGYGVPALIVVLALAGWFLFFRR